MLKRLVSWAKQRTGNVVCLLVAAFVHLLVLATYSIANPYGAEQEGHGGIEVGIGLATPTEVPEPVPEQAELELVEPAMTVPETPELTERMPDIPVIELQIDRPTLVLQPISTDLDFDLDSIKEQITSSMQTQVGFGSGATPTYGGDPSVRINYVAQVSARLNRFKTYPREARQAGHEGIVMLNLVINRDGSVSLFGVQNSAGFQTLDNAALEMVERAAPFAPFPVTLSEDSLRFNIPVTFTIESL